MKEYGEWTINLRFLDLYTLTWSPSSFDRFTLGERTHGTHWTGGWMVPRTSEVDVEERKILTVPGLVPRPSVIQPLASPYSLCPIPAITILFYLLFSSLCLYSLSIGFCAVK